MERRTLSVHCGPCGINGGCGERVCETRIVDHKTKCPKFEVACHYCPKMVQRGALRAHQAGRNECPNDGCNVTFQCKHLKRHLERCVFETIACPMKKFGCDSRCLRKDINAHCTSAMASHLTLSVTRYDILEQKLEKSVEDQKMLRDQLETLTGHVMKHPALSNPPQQRNAGDDPPRNADARGSEKSRESAQDSMHPNGGAGQSGWRGWGAHASNPVQNHVHRRQPPPPRQSAPSAGNWGQSGNGQNNFGGFRQPNVEIGMPLPARQLPPQVWQPPRGGYDGDRYGGMILLDGSRNDWKCSSCREINRSGRRTCVACGARKSNRHGR